MIKIAIPWSRNWWMIFWMLAIVTGSMPVNGSSSKMILGFETRALAISSLPPLAAGKRQGRGLAQAFDIELFQEFVAAAVAGFAVHAQHFHHAQEVFFHG